MAPFMLCAVAIMEMKIKTTRAMPRVMSKVLTLLVRRLLRLYLRGMATERNLIVYGFQFTVVSHLP